MTLGNVVLGTNARPQIDNEAEDVEGEDEGDSPFEASCDVAVMGPGGADEDDGKNDFDEDEGEFDPEAESEDSVFAVVDTETLVLSAEENGGDDVAADENEEANIVGRRMSVGVEDGEADETCGCGNGEE